MEGNGCTLLLQRKWAVTTGHAAEIRGQSRQLCLAVHASSYAEVRPSQSQPARMAMPRPREEVIGCEETLLA